MALGSTELHSIGYYIVNQHMDIKPYVEMTQVRPRIRLAS